MIMTWVAVNKDGSELVFYPRAIRNEILGVWDSYDTYGSGEVELPKGSIKKLIGRELTWEDEPVELE
jgi:hypothetical protein